MKLTRCAATFATADRRCCSSAIKHNPTTNNAMLGKGDDQASILPARIGKTVQEQAQYMFDPRG